ncbi:hypothetical protein AK812_SmicGene30533 [Symbiodinium microadriaticum]|uniref:Alkyl hydroperoxide reductase subunit C/ Thiol specific antioxidant domain-containing protein n=1 Tax=Symbiodinium microadriaticum TaxID=2951 RepID=A0A1Q9CYZ3_SYMMI|nr:hypothetical protein AK812_SmicGene30533 [Symbiodinium microadriaticum]
MGGSGDSQSANQAFATKFSFTFPLLCEALSLSSALGVSASRWAILVDADGKVEKFWGSVAARTFPQTALDEI